jgi:hypothetical protein
MAHASPSFTSHLTPYHIVTAHFLMFSWSDYQSSFDFKHEQLSSYEPSSNVTEDVHSRAQRPLQRFRLQEDFTNSLPIPSLRL